MQNIKIWLLITVLCTTPYVHAGDLSKDQVKKIANQYIEACLNKDYDAWKGLFLDVSDVSEADFTTPHIAKIKNIRIKEVDEYNVRLQIQYTYGRKEDGWLQLLPDGKIKYGAIVYQHPIPVAFVMQSYTAAYTQDDSLSDYPDLMKDLLKTGIPAFGLNNRMKPYKQLKSLDQIKKWLVENGGNWDRSEPKLACPEDQFKALLKKYK